MAVHDNKKKSAALGILMLLCIPMLAVGSNATRAANQEQDFSVATFCGPKCRICLLGAAGSCFSVLNVLWNKSEYCTCFVSKVIAEPCFFKK